MWGTIWPTPGEVWFPLSFQLPVAVMCCALDILSSFDPFALRTGLLSTALPLWLGFPSFFWDLALWLLGCLVYVGHSRWDEAEPPWLPFYRLGVTKSPCCEELKWVRMRFLKSVGPFYITALPLVSFVATGKFLTTSWVSFLICINGDNSIFLWRLS